MMTAEGIMMLLEWIGTGLVGLLILICALMFWGLIGSTNRDDWD
jgi:uncharacterized membrane protein